MGYAVAGPFACECGKQHYTAGISERSECTCGRKLVRQMYDFICRVPGPVAS